MKQIKDVRKASKVSACLMKIMWFLLCLRSWQTLTFDKQPASFIRIVGTHNTANEVTSHLHLPHRGEQGQKRERG